MKWAKSRGNFDKFGFFFLSLGKFYHLFTAQGDVLRRVLIVKFSRGFLKPRIEQWAMQKVERHKVGEQGWVEWPERYRERD